MKNEDITIRRINFLDQGVSVITYRSMIIAFIVWCVFLGLLYGVQFLRIYNVKGDIENSKQALIELESEKDVQIQNIRSSSNRNIGFSAKKDLSSILENRPLWSGVIDSITKSLTPQIWLSSVSVLGGKDGGYDIELRGKAKNQRSLTSFLMALESSGKFTGSSLLRSKASDGETKQIEYEIVTHPVTLGR